MNTDLPPSAVQIDIGSKETVMVAAVLNIGPEGNLSQYFRDIHKFPMLTFQDEQSLARRWRDAQDRDAAHQLIASHLRLVAKIAMGYRGYGLPVAELISEGNIGMIRAVERFDPDRGFRLASYAMWWIRAAIQEYVLHSWSLVKMGTTSAQKKLFFNLRRLKGQMQAIDDGDLQPEQVARIARTLSVAEHEVVSMNNRLSAADYSLNAPMGHDSDAVEWQDNLIDASEDQETTIANREELQSRRAMLPHALKSLKERERCILVARRLQDEPATLEDLAVKYDISRERVRQIEARAFEKLQRAVKARIADLASDDPCVGLALEAVPGPGRRDARVRSNWSQSRTPSRSARPAKATVTDRGSEGWLRPPDIAAVATS
jgi:RNA polymerase sigma-32 factor